MCSRMTYFTKTRTLIDAKKTSYAGNTASRRDEGSCRLATLHRTASGAASNPLRLGLNRESEQSSHSHDCPYVTHVCMFRIMFLHLHGVSGPARHRKLSCKLCH
jgi:hypothetical protein